MIRKFIPGKTSVVTLASNRVDFISMQLEGFNSHLKGDWEFIVLNNATDRSLRSAISAKCLELGIREIGVGIDFQIGLRGGEFAFRPWGYANPNLACSYAINWFWKHQLPHLDSEFLLFMDSDMFLVSDCDVSRVLDDVDFAFVPQFRGSSLEVYYPWNGIVFLRTATNNLESLNWHPGAVLGQRCDVGGQAHFWLKENSQAVQSKHLLALTVYGMVDGDEATYHVAVNGNWNSHLSFSEQKPVWDFSPFNSERPRPDTWNTVKRGTLYPESSTTMAQHLRSLVEMAELHNLPHPWYFDVIGLQDGEAAFDGFVFHYKSGSNYQPWVTEDYNKRKSEALRSLLGSAH